MPYKDRDKQLEYFRTYNAARHESQKEYMHIYNTQRRDRDSVKARWQEYYLEHKEVRLAKRKEKRLENPELFLKSERDYYHRNKAKRIAAGKAWREKNTERSKQKSHEAYIVWIELEGNRDKHKASTLAWQKKNPEKAQMYVNARRARLREAPVNDFTLSQWRIMKECYDHRCVYCNRRMERLTQDHMLPLSKNGSHTASNIVPACHSCNCKKNDGPPLPMHFQFAAMTECA